MRISDWSSDVCSSDTSNNRSTFSAKRSPLVSASPCSRSQPAGVRPVRQAPSLSLCASGTSGRRSEEHTSELQSLMRISYAVFCLKKKKHSTSNKDTHYNKQYK